MWKHVETIKRDRWSLSLGDRIQISDDFGFYEYLVMGATGE